MIEVHFCCNHHPIHRPPKQSNNLTYHRLAFQFLSILFSGLSVSDFLCVERREGVVVDERYEEAKGRKWALIVFLDEVHHNLNRPCLSNCFNHLFSIHNQIVLVYRLYQNWRQILNNRSTIRTFSSTLLLYLLKYHSYNIQF